MLNYICDACPRFAKKLQRNCPKNMIKMTTLALWRAELFRDQSIIRSDCSLINRGRSVTRYTVSSILVALTICAFASVTPAAAAGDSGDANGMREQAQIHPNEANQVPDYAPGFIAQGEVYAPWTVSGGHSVRSRADNAALVPFASNLPHVQNGLRRLDVHGVRSAITPARFRHFRAC